MNVWASVHSDFTLANTVKANLLIVGTKGVVDLLGVLLPDGNRVVMVQRKHDGLLLPHASAAIRTAILRDVDLLSGQEQRRLLDWLQEAAAHRIQVISTTSRPLLPLVQAGTFSEALYYHLNTVYIGLPE